MRLPTTTALLVAATVLALAPPAARAANADKEARAMFQRAEMSFNLGKFPEALADYQAAYEAKPLPGFLFNIAQCYRNMSNPERARFFYRRYLALEPRSSNRRLVEDLIGEMTRLMDKQAAEKAAAVPPPPPKPVEPAPTPPSPPQEPPPSDALLTLPTPPAAPAAAGAGAGETQASLVSTAPAPEPESHPVYKRWWFWAGVGAVVAGGVVAAVLLTRPDSPRGTLAPIDGR